MSYVAVFVAALLESLAVVGLFVPGTAVVITAGAAARAGEASTLLVIAAAALGAGAGGLFSFAFGLQLHGWKPLRPWLERHAEAVANAQRLLTRFGALAVFAASLLGPTRAFVPMLAGAGKMPARRFAVAHLSGSLVWALATVFAGGSAFALWERLPWQWSAAVAAALLTAWLGGRLIARAWRRRRGAVLGAERQG